MRLDLLIIRFASLNQILDPWVYILLRREVVWKLGHAVRMLCSRTTPEKEAINFRRQSSVLTADVSYTCCAFCYHCLCDPPESYRKASMSSFYGDFNTNHPTSNLALQTARAANVFLLETVRCSPGTSRNSKLKWQDDVDNDVTPESASVEEVVCSQPCDVHAKLLANGHVRSVTSDSSFMHQSML